jgi:hypothetical protein
MNGIMRLDGLTIFVTESLSVTLRPKTIQLKWVREIVSGLSIITGHTSDLTHAYRD